MATQTFKAGFHIGTAIRKAGLFGLVFIVGMAANQELNRPVVAAPTVAAAPIKKAHIAHKKHLTKKRHSIKKVYQVKPDVVELEERITNIEERLDNANIPSYDYKVTRH